MFFLSWMAIMIFIPVFAPSLPVLAFGEAMCGVSWGVFQVGPNKSVFAECQLMLSDPVHHLRVRSRSYRP